MSDDGDMSPRRQVGVLYRECQRLRIEQLEAALQEARQALVECKSFLHYEGTCPPGAAREKAEKCIEEIDTLSAEPEQGEPADNTALRLEHCIQAVQALLSRKDFWNCARRAGCGFPAELDDLQDVVIAGGEPEQAEEAGIDYPYPGEFDAETAMPDSEPEGRPVRPHRSGGGLPPDEPEVPLHVPYYLRVRWRQFYGLDSDPAEGEGGGDDKFPPGGEYACPKCGEDVCACDIAPPQRRDALEAAAKTALRFLRLSSSGRDHRLSQEQADCFADHINRVLDSPCPHVHTSDEGTSYCELAEDVGAKYHELLYAVETKHPGETRHETALRYIRQAPARPLRRGAAPQPDTQQGESDD